jgi:hypothetical protein
MSGVGGRRLAPLADVDFIQLSKIRSAANGKEGASRVRMGVLRECHRKRDISDEARAPKSIIQEGKKGFGGLMLVFMKIQVVTGFL